MYVKLNDSPNASYTLQELYGAMPSPELPTLTSFEGADFGRYCLEFYPELYGIVNEITYKKQAVGGTYSEQLFGKKNNEFDRILMRLRCLQLFTRGRWSDYHEFVKDQPITMKLERKSFDALCKQVSAALTSGYSGLSQKEIAKAFEAALLLPEICRSKLTTFCFAVGWNISQNSTHRVFMQILKEQPKLLLLFKNLPHAAQSLLVDIADLINYRQIADLEGGPEMFTKLQSSGYVNKNPFAVQFDFIVQTCVYAAAEGDKNCSSSLAYTERRHQNFQLIWTIVNNFKNSKISASEVYKFYLEQRAIGISLSLATDAEYVLTRLTAMLGSFNSEATDYIYLTILGMNASDQQRIVAQLKENQFAQTPRNLALFLAGLAYNQKLGETQKSRIENAVRIGLPFITGVLIKHKQDLDAGQANPEIALDFGRAAWLATQIAPQDNEAFKGWYIDQDGIVKFPQRGK
jgi:hypothetical protein